MERPSREEMIADVISVLLDGLRIHPAAAARELADVSTDAATDTSLASHAE